MSKFSIFCWIIWMEKRRRQTQQTGRTDIPDSPVEWKNSMLSPLSDQHCTPRLLATTMQASFPMVWMEA